MLEPAWVRSGEALAGPAGWLLRDFGQLLVAGICLGVGHVLALAATHALGRRAHAWRAARDPVLGVAAPLVEILDGLSAPGAAVESQPRRWVAQHLCAAADNLERWIARAADYPGSQQRLAMTACRACVADLRDEGSRVVAQGLSEQEHVTDLILQVLDVVIADRSDQVVRA
jgi:hypothetical protein